MMNIEPLSLRKDILNFAKLEVGHMDFAWFRLTLPRAMPAVEPLATRRLRPRARCAARATVWSPRPVGPSLRAREPSRRSRGRHRPDRSPSRSRIPWTCGQVRYVRPAEMRCSRWSHRASSYRTAGPDPDPSGGTNAGGHRGGLCPAHHRALPDPARAGGAHDFRTARRRDPGAVSRRDTGDRSSRQTRAGRCAGRRAGNRHA